VEVLFIHWMKLEDECQELCCSALSVCLCLLVVLVQCAKRLSHMAS
jgi:hypothetical protein